MSGDRVETITVTVGAVSITIRADSDAGQRIALAVLEVISAGRTTRTGAPR